MSYLLRVDLGPARQGAGPWLEGRGMTPCPDQAPGQLQLLIVGRRVIRAPLPAMTWCHFGEHRPWSGELACARMTQVTAEPQVSSQSLWTQPGQWGTMLSNRPCGKPGPAVSPPWGHGGLGCLHPVALPAAPLVALWPTDPTASISATDGEGWVLPRATWPGH